MDVTSFLHSRGADLASVIESARIAVGLAPTDVLLAVGSLVEGLGNSKSDLDLVLITPRELSTLPREVAIVVGRCLSDIEVVPLSELDVLIERVRTWASLPWDVTRAAKFTLDERRLLHRLLHCSVLYAGDTTLLARLPGQDVIARLKLHVARHTARTIQVDLAGNRECKDYSSLVFGAQELLVHALDGLTASHMLTNPTAKWRSRVAEQLPTDWERALGTRLHGETAAGLLWRLHRAPERPVEELALEHALRIATFARAVFVSAERRLVDGDHAINGVHSWPELDKPDLGPPLPYLDLDVDLSEADGSGFIGRLNEFDEPLELSPPEFAATLLFDGKTTAREAEAVIRAAYRNVSEDSVVDRVQTRLAEARLTVLATP